MKDKINEGRRNVLKAAGLAGIAIMCGMSEKLLEARSTSPGFIKRAEIPYWYKPGDLRDFVKLLDQKNELVKIKEEVDPKHEIGSLLWQNEYNRKGVIFENVRGSNMRVIGGLYQDWRRIGLSLGVTGRFGPSEMYDLFRSAMAKPISPREVKSAYWKDVILTGDRIDMSKLPVPTLFERDGGPYITAGVGVCRNPETNAYNLGVYRMQVIDRGKILVWAFPGSDLHYIYKAYEKVGKEMDFAVVIGAEPTIFTTAVSKVPPDIDEISVAGALKNKEIEVTRGETVDLLIPSSAEIVIEGKIDPKIRIMDGPFADHGGIYKGGPSPILKISAICHRKDAFFHTILSGDSMEHCTTAEILACFWARNILEHLQSKFEGVKDVNLFWRDGAKKWVAVSLSEKKSNKEPREIIKEIFNLRTTRYRMPPVSVFLRTVVIVNEDIDIYDSKEVAWAVGTRLIDCMVIEEDKAKGYGLRIGLDATLPIGVSLEKFKRAKTKPISL